MAASTFLADLEELSIDEDSYMEDSFLDSVSNLHNTHRYNQIMQRVEEALTNRLILDDDESIVEHCNSLSLDIDNEIATIHALIRDKYRSNFPELESLVPHPIDYARVVKKIGDETDLALVDLQGLVPSATIIAVVSLTSRNRPLSGHDLHETINACDKAVALDAARTRLLEFIESRMGRTAPNLSAVVGAAVAAKLTAAVGGLSALKNMPACNLQLLGGYLEQTEIFQATPPSLRRRTRRFLAAKSALASRLDCMKADPIGRAGKSMRDEILKKIEKWQEAPPAKHPKPLRVPDSAPRRKRGGVRLRKTKERYGVTEMRKWANRMAFGVPEDSSLGDGYGEGYGMLTGKLRVAVRPGRLGVKVANKFKKKACGGATSNLAFTPVQGLELNNPRPLGVAAQTTYFSQTATFSKVKTC